MASAPRLRRLPVLVPCPSPPSCPAPAITGFNPPAAAVLEPAQEKAQHILPTAPPSAPNSDVEVVERIRHLCRVEEEEEAGKDGQGPKACMDMTICSNSGDVYQGHSMAFGWTDTRYFLALIGPPDFNRFISTTPH